MPVARWSEHRRAATIMVARSCIAGGEVVTILVPTEACADELRPRFSEEELKSLRFFVVERATNLADAVPVSSS
jgi:hypothetical protein